VTPARPAAGGTEAEAPKSSTSTPGWLKVLMLLLSGLLGGFIAPHVGPDTPVPAPVKAETPKPTPAPVTKPVPPPPPVVTTPKPVPPPAPKPAQPPVVSSARKLLQFHNAERARAGLRPLLWNDELEQAAIAQAAVCAAAGKPTHDAPDGRTFPERIAASGYPAFSRAGENAAEASSPAEAMTMWMASPGHRANILDPHYRDFGAAFALGKDGRYWSVTDFGGPP
jgi:uncharacterized protein YkwD